MMRDIGLLISRIMSLQAMYERILVPLDGSELAEMAIRHAHALAKSQRAQITLLRVIVFPTRDYDVIPMQAPISPAILADAKRYLEHIAGNLRRLGVTVATQVKSGPVSDTIIDFCSENHMHLIVMSTHGRTGAARWLLGSVAERVVQGAPVPVLLIRPHRG